LRFDNPQTYRVLRLVAEQRGMSMNDIVQEALEAYLREETASTEERLRAALKIVQEYRAEEQLELYAKAFARAEVTEEDPMRATRVEQPEDRFGIRKAFVRSME
jgi:hypothetical protein